MRSLEDIFSSFKPLAEQKNLLYHLVSYRQRFYMHILIPMHSIRYLTNLFSNAVKYAKSKVELHLLTFDSKEIKLLQLK